jgi:hypothetical protein
MSRLDFVPVSLSPSSGLRGNLVTVRKSIDSSLRRHLCRHDPEMSGIEALLAM